MLRIKIFSKIGLIHHDEDADFYCFLKMIYTSRTQRDYNSYDKITGDYNKKISYHFSMMCNCVDSKWIQQKDGLLIATLL